MLNTILSHTPLWVFGILAALVALGSAQMKTRQMTVQRASAIPLVMVVLSLMGTVSAFPGSALALASWATAFTLTTATRVQQGAPRDAAYHPETRRFTVPGSTVPLLLMMGIFFTKYAAGASLGLQPQLAQLPGFACVISAAYGVFSGAFLARGWRLWRLRRATAGPRMTRP